MDEDEGLRKRLIYFLFYFFEKESRLFFLKQDTHLFGKENAVFSDWKASIVLLFIF